MAKVVQHYQKFGTIKSVNKRSGRPRKLTSRLDRYVTREVSQNPRKSATELVNYLRCVVSTFQRQLYHEPCIANLHRRRPRRKPLLKPRHNTARLEFVRKYIEKSSSFCDTILWSDKTIMNLFGSDGMQQVWRRAGDEYADKNVVPTVKHDGGSLMVWGCMSFLGVDEQHFIDGIMNAQMYCNILAKKMIPSLKALGRGAVFQHDNDPKHSVKATSAFLKKKRVKVLDWPSMSSDLNPIEHV